MNLCCKPIENCYWVNKNLLASEYLGHVKVPEARLRLRRFPAEGLDYFMDLTQVKELEPYKQMLRGHWETVSRDKRWGHPNTLESPAQHQMVLDWQEP